MQKQEWSLAHGRRLELGPRSIIMGVLNVTPDSFSDGGRYEAVEVAVAHARRMRDEGADIIDIGGESTRPGSEPVSPAEEQARVLPVIAALAKEPGMILSIDTYRAETARLAVEAGAHIINDVWGLHREPAIADVAAERGAGLMLMHNGREREKLADVVADQFSFLGAAVETARARGVQDRQVVLDPGFGFAKEPEENIALMARLGELGGLEFPLAVGTSRKRFVGHFTGRDAEDRDVATAATSALLRLKGASIFRVHNVGANRDALSIADAMVAAQA